MVTDSGDLIERIAQMLIAAPKEEVDYYALTILLGEGETLEDSAFTHFAGFTDESRRFELREASIVHADRMLKAWRTMGEPGLVVNTPDEFGIFFHFGGHAVVAQELAESVVPEWLVPKAMVRVGEAGFAAQSCLPLSAIQRAPTPKLRMSVIKRDGYRCRVCGRSPSEHVDVELHVHHIRPWAAGGVTEQANLITLCHTCHNGLAPHFEYELFSLLPRVSIDRAKLYEDKLIAYQAHAARHSKKADV